MTNYERLKHFIEEVYGELDAERRSFMDGDSEDYPLEAYENLQRIMWRIKTIDEVPFNGKERAYD